MVTIAAVARQTGIQAATLRKWEARYGFPVPARTAGDHRVFDASDLDALLEVSRRMAAGERAGLAISAVKRGLTVAPLSGVSSQAERQPGAVPRALNWLQRNELQALEVWMADQLAERGAAVFSREIAVPLIEAVGALWQQGSLPIYAEHLFSSTLHKVLQQPAARRAVSSVPRPHLLLASPAGEQHMLALLLLHAVLNQAGIPSIHVVGGLPASEIAAAAIAMGVQIVALSASVACQPKPLVAELRSLRTLLPESVELWVGGHGVLRISSRMDGVTVMPTIDTAMQALKSWGHMSPAVVGTKHDKAQASPIT
jgi:DNA-binding transcriptional MerR regulator/methylmalonyl-CoA mutase cobalamin-binding subunit